MKSLILFTLIFFYQISCLANTADIELALVPYPSKLQKSLVALTKLKATKRDFTVIYSHQTEGYEAILKVLKIKGLDPFLAHQFISLLPKFSSSLQREYKTELKNILDRYLKNESAMAKNMALRFIHSNGFKSASQSKTLLSMLSSLGVANDLKTQRVHFNAFLALIKTFPTMPLKSEFEQLVRCILRGIALPVHAISRVGAINAFNYFIFHHQERFILALSKSNFFEYRAKLKPLLKSFLRNHPHPQQAFQKVLRIICKEKINSELRAFMGQVLSEYGPKAFNYILNFINSNPHHVDKLATTLAKVQNNWAESDLLEMGYGLHPTEVRSSIIILGQMKDIGLSSIRFLVRIHQHDSYSKVAKNSLVAQLRKVILANEERTKIKSISEASLRLLIFGQDYVSDKLMKMQIRRVLSKIDSKALASHQDSSDCVIRIYLRTKGKRPEKKKTAELEKLFRKSLKRAVQNGHVKKVRSLFKKGAEPNSPLFFHVIRKGNLEVFQAFLDSPYFSTKFKDRKGRTAVHYAVRFNRELMLKKLLELGMEKSPKDIFGKVPMHYSIYTKNLNWLMRLATEYKMPIFAQDNQGKTLLHLAAFQGQSEMVRFLLQLGHDVNLLDKNQRTADFDAIFGACQRQKANQAFTLIHSNLKSKLSTDFLGKSVAAYFCMFSQRKSYLRNVAKTLKVWQKEITDFHDQVVSSVRKTQNKHFSDTGYFPKDVYDQPGFTYSTYKNLTKLVKQKREQYHKLFYYRLRIQELLSDITGGRLRLELEEIEHLKANSKQEFQHLTNMLFGKGVPYSIYRPGDYLVEQAKDVFFNFKVLKLVYTPFTILLDLKSATLGGPMLIYLPKMGPSFFNDLQNFEPGFFRKRNIYDINHKGVHYYLSDLYSRMYK